MVDLLFTAGLGNGDLVFGSSGTPPVILALGSSATMPAATLAGELNADGVVMGGAPVAPAISSPLHVSEVPALSMAATMGAPAPALGLGYDNAVNRAPFLAWWLQRRAQVITPHYRIYFVTIQVENL